mmetsp:Transcript_65966/g.109632  ORF Transcript_65966/g.109632 Transcript_65966/m.109632 type:complete len:501 (+) Transcript_65966:55-1557(+)
MTIFESRGTGKASQLLAEAQCPMDKMYLREFGTMAYEDAVYYASSEAFNNETGVVLTKYLHNLAGLAPGLRNSTWRRRSTLLPRGRVMIGTCYTHTTKGTWYTQRIGPFRSTGGNSWWFAGWSNLAHLQVPGRLRGISAHVVGAVNEAGKIMPNPPILMHHTSCMANNHPDVNSLRYATGPIFLDVSGDAQCAASFKNFDSPYSTECNGLDYGVRVVATEARVDCYFAFVDVRTKHSLPLSWWHHISVRVNELTQTPPSQLQLIVPHTINNLAPKPSVDRKSGKILHSKNWLTFAAPTQTESFYYHYAAMPISGHWEPELTKFHTHTVNFQGGLAIVGATAKQLGLGLQCSNTQRYGLYIGCDAEPPYVVLARSNADLKSMILRKLRKVQQVSKLDKNHRLHPRIVCTMIGTRANVQGVLYGRASLQMCTPWHFERGDKLLTIGFYGPPQHMPPDGLSREGASVAQHLHWYMFYGPSDSKPHASVVYADQTREGIRNVFS